MSLVYEYVDMLAQLDDVFELCPRKRGLGSRFRQLPGHPIDGNCVDDHMRPLALNVVSGPDVETAVIADGPILAGSAWTHAVAQVG